jgi:hypothetical protein
VERLGKYDEIERPACRLPVLERRLLHADALTGGYGCHARVRLHGKDFGARLHQLHRRDARPRSDVECPRTTSRHQAGNERLRIARTVAVVVIGS